MRSSHSFHSSGTCCMLETITRCAAGQAPSKSRSRAISKKSEWALRRGAHWALRAKHWGERGEREEYQPRETEATCERVGARGEKPHLPAEVRRTEREGVAEVAGGDAERLGGGELVGGEERGLRGRESEEVRRGRRRGGAA